MLVAGVILWNTRYLQAAFDTLEHEVNAPSPALLRHVASLGWEHISLTGDDIWTEDAMRRSMAATRLGSSRYARPAIRPCL